MRYGVSERDTWSLDYHISNVIVKGIQFMLQGMSGTPFGEDEDCGMIQQIYMDIIYTFEIEKAYANNDIWLPNSLEEESWEEYREWIGRCEAQEFIISKEHYEYYLHGWEMFRMFHGCLWT